MNTWTFADRPKRHGIADCATRLYVHVATAARDDIDVERMRETWAAMGIELVTEMPHKTPAGLWVCHGCGVEYARDRECWAPCDLTVGGWRPLCRVCENTEWSDGTLSRRLAQYKADPGLRTRPGRGVPSPSWDDTRQARRSFEALGKRRRSRNETA